LHGLAAWLDQEDLRGPEFTELIDHLWEFQVVERSEMLMRWHDSAPDLIDVALGGEMPDALIKRCLDRGIPTAELRCMLESTAEIVYYNVFGAVNDQATMNYLRQVESLLMKYGLSLPAASLFSKSLFLDAHGWGPELTADEAGVWRFRKASNKPVIQGPPT
jgi:hypothetical protein